MKDPTKAEMMQFLLSRYRDGGAEFDAEAAIYWFGYSYHGGQWSNLYSALSTSPYHPGPMETETEPDSMARFMYDDLVAEYVQ